MPGFFTKRNQLQWLGLLVLAVVVPSVSLLWFMSRVIANERLVVQEKLRVLYQDKLSEATVKTESLFKARLADLDRIAPTANPYSLFRRLVLENNFQGVVVWDADGSIIYPRAREVMGNDVSINNPLAEAWQAEFANRDYAGAVELYERFTTHGDLRVAITALTGKTRCLSRLGRLNQAISEGQKAAFTPVTDHDDPALCLAVENARLLLLSLLKQSPPSPANSTALLRTVNALMSDLYNSEDDRALIPAGQNLFIAQKVLEALHDIPSFDNSKAKAGLEKLVAAEELSIAAAETLRPFEGQFDAVFRTRLGETPAHGLRHKTAAFTVLVLLSDAGIASALSGYEFAFKNSEAAYRVVDAFGAFVAGTEKPQGSPFNVTALPQGFPGWKVELYFQGGDVFDRAASRQIAVYTWTGFLVILLILIVGGFAMRVVGRQIRLNEMKNDFIATVSHELKTPLASMRVLVDTLLEGHIKDEAQVNRYLQLTAKENERLSRMIDNFLTFSRMERNKKAFTLTDTVPATVANDAVEAVQTKFAARNCQFTTEIATGLPEIQADHDAIVTVLVNLLDNACKYTTDNKQISLRVFGEPGVVCFAVADNGVGLARKHLRKIFDSFYQVDSSLARKAEGCGLGLSIVKFIVDAHSGKIAVESKPGQGSTFTVRLPVGHGNGNGTGLHNS